MPHVGFVAPLNLGFWENWHHIKACNFVVSAPEILSTWPYGHSVDWWSLGIMMYALLAGHVSRSHNECSLNLVCVVPMAYHGVIRTGISREDPGSNPMLQLQSLSKFVHFTLLQFTQLYE